MRTDIIDRKSEILLWISEGQTNAEIARRLACKIDTLLSYYKKPILELIGNPNISNSKKRIRLIEEGVKEGKCECCGLSEWMGKPIPLELHHKDFNHYNNSLDNLQILCANCHMQAHNYCNTIK